jgi:protocatechuate 3,4-dioxygenase beta subunit
MRKSAFIIVFLLTTFFLGCGRPSNSSSVSKTDRDTLDIPPKIKMVADNEPGEPMIISGTIYLPDGKTPASGAILSVWHTDSKGYYIEGGGGAGELHPRIHGRMKTGADGKYEFRTVKPAPYPSNNTPAHVHGHLSAPSFPEYPIIYYFEGDKLITDKNRSELNRRRGGTPSIITLTKNNEGVLIGTRDLILEYVKPSDETMKLKW